MPCDLTVIVAQVDRRVSLSRCIAALNRACTNMRAEIVVVQSAEVSPEPVASSGTPIRIIRVAGGALVPQLWAQGLHVAQGHYVGFTLANCEVSDDWAEKMVAALQEGVVGVAGPIACGRDAGLVDRGVYYLRYSAFMPERVTDADVNGELPGDNAAYRRAALDEHRDVIADGFWDAPFHRRLRREGGRLGMRCDARARFCGGLSLPHGIRHRFAHGRHFGAWRVAEGIRRPWQIIAVAPMVPLLLGTRAASRVLGLPAHRWPFLSGAPALLALAVAWAVGEAVGALRGAGLPTPVVNDEIRCGVSALGIK